MSMHKSSTKHMSAEAEDQFQENLEGSDVGCIDDWETELGLKILKIESKIDSTSAMATKNVPVINMLTRKLVTYNAALLFLEENPKAATVVGSHGGLDSVVSYITKQAVEDMARAETRKYSNLIIPELPGYKITSKLAGGLVGAAPVGRVLFS